MRLDAEMLRASALELAFLAQQACRLDVDQNAASVSSEACMLFRIPFGEARPAAKKVLLSRFESLTYVRLLTFNGSYYGWK
jgi:hypothetical protein